MNQKKKIRHAKKRRDFVRARERRDFFLASGKVMPRAHVLTATERSLTELKQQISGLQQPRQCYLCRGSKQGGPNPYSRNLKTKKVILVVPGHAHLLSAVISHSFTVLSLEALTSSRLSADHATWYTAPTCPFNVARKVPVRPSQTLTFLSKDALAKRRPSGLNARWFTGCWWPVRRASIFLSSTGFQRQSVKSSDPDTNRSGSPPLR